MQEEMAQSTLSSDSPVRPMETPMKSPAKIIWGVYILLALLGIGTGYLLAQKNAGSVAGSGGAKVNTAKTVGSTDTKAFPPLADGVIEKGGIDGEGTHKLIRDPKRPDQTAYLISSVVDLDEFVGKKVKVYGETFAAKKASWLIDVGRLDLLE